MAVAPASRHLNRYGMLPQRSRNHYKKSESSATVSPVEPVNGILEDSDTGQEGRNINIRQTKEAYRQIRPANLSLFRHGGIQQDSIGTGISFPQGPDASIFSFAADSISLMQLS